MHHAYLIEAEPEEGVTVALSFIERTLGLRVKANPDVVILRRGLLSVEDARRAGELAQEAAFSGSARAIVISASRAYAEAQNALLKLFEEPPTGTYLFLVVPSLGGLLPTLRSRVEVLGRASGARPAENPAEEFLSGSKERRAAIVKKLSSGRDDDERRENRDRAIALIDGIEAAYMEDGVAKHASPLRELSTLRDFLHDRSAPVKQILEHLALTTPRNLL